MLTISRDLIIPLFTTRSTMRKYFLRFGQNLRNKLNKMIVEFMFSVVGKFKSRDSMTLSR